MTNNAHSGGLINPCGGEVRVKRSSSTPRGDLAPTAPVCFIGIASYQSAPILGLIPFCITLAILAPLLISFESSYEDTTRTPSFLPVCEL